MSDRAYEASRVEHEGDFLATEDWASAPEAVCKLARKCSAEQIPTAIVKDAKLGWCVLCCGQGPMFAYVEHEHLL